MDNGWSWLCEDIETLSTYVTDGYTKEVLANAEKAIRNLSARAIPVRRGRWEQVKEQKYYRKRYHVVACSACHKRGNIGWRFCPNCGAEMEVTDERT